MEDDGECYMNMDEEEVRLPAPKPKIPQNPIYQRTHKNSNTRTQNSKTQLPNNPNNKLYEKVLNVVILRAGPVVLTFSLSFVNVYDPGLGFLFDVHVPYARILS